MSDVKDAVETPEQQEEVTNKPYKKGYTEMAIIVDKSGSMCGLKQSTIDGINKFIEEQRRLKGDANATLVFFANQVDALVEASPITDLTMLTDESYVPNGGTALNDAVGGTIDKMKDRISSMDENERPEYIVFVIMTDGQENASKTYSGSQVSEMIETQTNDGWHFIFLGAGIDADKAATDLNVAGNHTRGYGVNYEESVDAYFAASNSVMSLRSGEGLTSVRVEDDEDSN